VETPWAKPRRTRITSRHERLVREKNRVCVYIKDAAALLAAEVLDGTVGLDRVAVNARDLSALRADGFGAGPASPHQSEIAKVFVEQIGDGKGRRAHDREGLHRAGSGGKLLLRSRASPPR